MSPVRVRCTTNSPGRSFALQPGVRRRRRKRKARKMGKLWMEISKKALADAKDK